MKRIAIALMLVTTTAAADPNVAVYELRENAVGNERKRS
jgi:hypothetical protein